MLPYMRDRWRLFWAFTQNASALITIGTALPLIVSVGAVIWGHMDKLPGLALSVLGLGVFMTVLWSYIGILSLIKSASKGSKYDLDCSWGLIIDLIHLSRDVQNPNAEWQIRLRVRNKLDWPLKLMLTEFRVEIENVTPTSSSLGAPFHQVITAKDVTGVISSPYKRGTLPDKERFEGKIDVQIHYGHPDAGYSRTMVRKLAIGVVVKPMDHPAYGFQPSMFGGVFPIATVPREPDADYPYVAPPPG